ncbi:hypothetical protein ACWG0P_07105 [Amedibacillus sp. YH-ame6]
MQAILKERNLEERGKVQQYIDSEALRLMSPYTPKMGGPLIDSATTMTDIGSGLVKQGGAKAPYGKKWYYNPAKFTGAPKRGNMWFERTMNEGGRKSIFEGVIRMTGAKKV